MPNDLAASKGFSLLAGSCRFVEQQAQLVLSSSFWTRQVVHDHLLIELANNVFEDFLATVTGTGTGVGPST